MPAGGNIPLLYDLLAAAALCQNDIVPSVPQSDVESPHRASRLEGNVNTIAFERSQAMILAHQHVATE